MCWTSECLFPCEIKLELQRSSLCPYSIVQHTTFNIVSTCVTLFSTCGNYRCGRTVYKIHYHAYLSLSNYFGVKDFDQGCAGAWSSLG